jgi:hypothetical protein
VTANFLFLACAENLVSEYYAFCDQDDVWDADKLARAIDALERTDSSIPALYGSRARLIDDEAGNEIGFSSLFHGRNSEVRWCKASRAETLWFSIKKLVVFSGADVDVPSHDWWLYQVTSACRACEEIGLPYRGAFLSRPGNRVCSSERQRRRQGTARKCETL